MSVVDFLPTGRQNARTQEALATLTGWTVRECQAAIEEARQHEVPICSATDEPMGMYLAADAAELSAFIETYDRRLRTMVRTRSGLRRALRRMRATEAKVETPSLWDAA